MKSPAPITRIAMWSGPRNISTAMMRAFENRADTCVVVLGGNNKPLLGRLAPMTAKRPGRLACVSFTDRVQELASVCTLMVTKAGGITTAECLARGTPMALLKPVPGQEANNAAYYRDHGAALISRGPRHAAAETARLLQDRDALARMAQAAAALYQPATETVVAEVLRRLGDDRPEAQGGGE